MREPNTSHGPEQYVSLAASHGAASSPSSPSSVGLQRWLAPASLLLSSLFFQNAGLYSATCEYVRWTDETLAKLAGQETVVAIEADALEDPVHRLLKASKLADSLEGLSWSPEIWVDLMADCVIIFLLCWLVRKNDLQT